MKKVIWSVSVIVFIGFSYYLFVRPFEFQVNFTANTLPGDLIETIRIWDRSMDDARILEVDSFARLKQAIVRDNRSYIYDWVFFPVNDSVTKVIVRISEPDHRLQNKFLVLLGEPHIEKDGGDIVREFYEILKEHLKITRVKVKGEAELEPLFCACRTIETSQIEKAQGMMREFPLLTSFVSDHKLRGNGPPIVKVHAWNHQRGDLKYDFCFPIHPTDSLPATDLITYKNFVRQKVLKAEYYGNYITSDRSWYALIDYANKHGYKVDGHPIEYFFNNPNLGANESEWKAEVYLPVK